MDPILFTEYVMVEAVPEDEKTIDEEKAVAPAPIERPPPVKCSQPDLTAFEASLHKRDLEVF